MKLEIELIKKTGASKSAETDELQNERDQLIMKNEALTDLLSKNNINMPPATSQEKVQGGKRTQTLIDEYKHKAAKLKEESEKKTADILAKSKKIAELTSAMKRDEALLKKAISDTAKYKKELSN